MVNENNKVLNKEKKKDTHMVVTVLLKYEQLAGKKKKKNNASGTSKIIGIKILTMPGELKLKDLIEE